MRETSSTEAAYSRCHKFHLSVNLFAGNMSIHYGPNLRTRKKGKRIKFAYAPCGPSEGRLSPVSVA